MANTLGTGTVTAILAVLTSLWWRDAGPPPGTLEPVASVPAWEQVDPAGDHSGAARSDAAALETTPPARSAAEQLVGQPQVTARLVSEARELKVYFEADQAALDADARGALSALAEAVKGADTVLRLRVAAHSDDGQDEAYNQALSDRRAEAVRAFLERKGVMPVRIEADGYGSLFPSTSDGDDSARARNRRAEIRIEWVERVPVGEPSG